MINLRQLEIFIAVVECGQITKAANKLYISQPSVSQTIMDIEIEYNVKLFDRLNKKLYLTPLGKHFYERAIICVKMFKDMNELLLDSSRLNIYNLGVTVTIGNLFLPKLINELSQNENIQFEKILVDNTERIETKILNGNLDFAIIEGNVNNENIKAIEIYNDELVFVANNQFKMVDNKIENFIIRELGSGTREKSFEILEQSNIRYKNLWEISSTEAIKNCLKTNVCASIMSKLNIKKELMEKELITIFDKSYYRPFFLIFHKDKQLDDHIILEVKKIFEEKIFIP